ncbi:MAG: DegV family protein [Clostridia bacterium]|nr:DegV family protein [Clostridia bacterium]
MSKKIVIASDSTTDLGSELISKYQIKILPLGVNIGDKHYMDGVDIDPEFIYKTYEETGVLPKTSAANIVDYNEFFSKYTADGASLIFFSISEEMSSTYRNAVLAAEDFENVYVVDTRNLSTGGGLVVLSACEMAEQGMAASEIAEKCREIATRVDASFIIDNLEFLYKGGRCSAVAAFGANLLQIKPCIMVRDGKMGVGKKYRGKFVQVLEKYIADMLGDASDIELDKIFVTHAGCDTEIVDKCVEQVKKTAKFDNVYVTRAGCTVSAHCGRNTLGVLFIRKNIVK